MLTTEYDRRILEMQFIPIGRALQLCEMGYESIPGFRCGNMDNVLAIAEIHHWLTAHVRDDWAFLNFIGDGVIGVAKGSDMLPDILRKVVEVCARYEIEFDWIPDTYVYGNIDGNSILTRVEIEGML